jgi:RimJ/RimL family protein N-acetyltransferase
MNIEFRLLKRSDFPQLQTWLQQPHIDQWWHQNIDLKGVEEKYGPRVDGTQPTSIYVIMLDKEPSGWIQWYRWADYPVHARALGAPENTAGVDLALAKPELLGRGLGPQIIDLFLEKFVFIHQDIVGIVSDPETANLRSLRAFEKAGFQLSQSVQLEGEAVERRVVTRRRE